MNVTIFDVDGESILQRVQLHTSCSQDLFLKDRYSANQFTGFLNDAQGLNDCFIPVNYTFLITNEGEVSAEMLSLVALTTPFDPFNLTD